MCSCATEKWVEQRTENPCVGGSIPPLATITFHALRLAFELAFLRFGGALYRKSAGRYCGCSVASVAQAVLTGRMVDTLS